MDSFIRWVFGVIICIAVAGNLKAATLKMAEMALNAQKGQLSYAKFNRMLTTPTEQFKKRHLVKSLELK